jgi:Domain of unknown function (DUF1707)
MVMASFPQPGGPAQPQPDAAIRASDADREAVVAVLHDAVMRGLLTLDEGNDRVAAAYAARHLRDLPALTADLPPAPAPAPVAPGWRALATLAWLQLRTAMAGLTWRDVRARPRVALAVVAALVVLVLGAVTAASFGGAGGGGFDGPRWEQHANHVGPR